jgi:hypothetical protein
MDDNRISTPQSLDNRATSFSPTWHEGRRRAFALRYQAGRIMHGEAVRHCGRKVFGAGATVIVTEGKARFSTVHTCKSVWMCPVCAGFVADGRRREVRDLVDAHCRAHRDGAVFMAAFTMPHHRFQTAKELRWAVSRAWSKIIAGKPWIAAKARARCAGWVRALEVTHGDHGWHPHIHAVFFLEDAAGADEFGIWLFERWARAIERLGYGECSPRAWSWERAAYHDAVVDYVVKGNFDRELTSGHTKLGKRGGRSPFQLLADAAEGDMQAAALFREFAEAFKGARQVTYAKGLRDDAATDDDLADAAAGELIGILPTPVFAVVMFRGLGPSVLEAAERGGWGAVLEYLCGEGIHVGNARRLANAA